MSAAAAPAEAATAKPVLSVRGATKRFGSVLALDGGPVGTEIIERMIGDCPARLCTDGWIALEIGHDQAPAVAGFC